MEKALHDTDTSLQGSIDIESTHDELAEIEKVERVYRKLDFRIIPGDMRTAPSPLPPFGLLSLTRSQHSGSSISSARPSVPMSASHKL